MRNQKNTTLDPTFDANMKAGTACLRTKNRCLELGRIMTTGERLPNGCQLRSGFLLGELHAAKKLSTREVEAKSVATWNASQTRLGNEEADERPRQNSMGEVTLKLDRWLSSL